MADIGINFRLTAGFVTDGANETYCQNGDAYPTTRGGVTFGWTGGHSGDGRDRDNTLDRRLAGLHQKVNDGSPATFLIDLPAAGQWVVSLANGDGTQAQNYQQLELKDGATSLLSIVDTNGTAATHWNDATGVDRTDVTWPTDNAPATITMSGTQLSIMLGSTTAQANSSSLAHIRLVQAAVSLGEEGLLYDVVTRW